MRRFKERRSGEWRKVVYSKPVLLIMAVLVLLLGRSVVGVLGKYTDSRRARTIAEAELVELVGRHEQVTTKVGSLQTERGVEAAVRERYNAVLPGEKVIILVREEDSRF